MQKNASDWKAWLAVAPAYSNTWSLAVIVN
jgi:hypothetical protein